MKKFKKGDRVIVRKNGRFSLIEKTGTVIDTERYATFIGVKHDTPVPDGGNLSGQCEMGYGMWYLEEQLSLLEEKGKISVWGQRRRNKKGEKRR